MKNVQTKISRNFLSAPLTLFQNAILTVIYPQACKICEKSVESCSDDLICRKCWRTTRIFNGNEILCRKCGAFLKEGFSEFETFCRRCDSHFYDEAKAVGIYEKALLVSLLNLKNSPFVPDTLQKLFTRAFENSSFRDSTIIIPVPLSKRRFKERGFNQASILADVLSKASSIKSNDKILKRKLHTSIHRAGMDAKSRFKSVENAFEVTSPKLIKDARVLLVDDIFTSGATVSSCAQVLKQNGAEKVYVLAAARAF